VHLAAIGHPIQGCRFYAPPAVSAAASRLLLHAEVLSFTHPVSVEQLTVSSPVPF